MLQAVFLKRQASILFNVAGN